jgi:hypothetical protein
MHSPITRRSFATAAAIGVLLARLGRPAVAQVIDPRPPTVDTAHPREVADGVWIIPDRRVWLVPNIDAGGEFGGVLAPAVVTMRGLILR